MDEKAEDEDAGADHVDALPQPTRLGDTMTLEELLAGLDVDNTALDEIVVLLVATVLDPMLEAELDDELVGPLCMAELELDTKGLM